MTFNEFKDKLYAAAEKESDVAYAKECLDFADKIGEIERFFKNGKSVESTIYLLCY